MGWWFGLWLDRIFVSLSLAVKDHDGTAPLIGSKRRGVVFGSHGEFMPIWKLSPIDLKAEEWKRSMHKGDAIIRAQNEEEARDVATSCFDQFARDTTRTLLCPWPNPALVQCIQLESDSSWEADGPPAVLDPAD